MRAVAGLALVACAAAQCSVRLINELPQPAALSTAGGTAVSQAAAHSQATYASVSCDTTSLTLTPNGGQGITVQILGLAPATPAASVIAFTNGAGQAAGSSVLDETALLPTGPEFIDMCSVRVLNAASSSRTLNGVTAVCSLNCSKDALGTAMAPGTATSYDGFFDCSSAWLYDVVDGVSGAKLASDVKLRAYEHGAYTLLITANPAAGASAGPQLVLLVDAQPPNPFIPLYVALAVLPSIFIAHCILGRVLATCLARRAVAAGNSTVGDAALFPDDLSSTNGPRKSSKSSDDGTIGIMAFLGWDKLVAKATAAARASSDASASAAAGGRLWGEGASAMHSSLLGAAASPFAAVNDGGLGMAGAAAASGVSAGSTASGAAITSTKPKSAGRVRGIDALRGLSLSGMVFVNAGAGGYSWLDHTPWNGLNLADVLFPTFVWSQGVSMAISFDAMRRRGASRAAMARRVIERAIKLYALGAFLNGGADFSNWRLLGVLQYFAMSYLFVGLLETFVRPARTSAASASSSSGDSHSYFAVNRSSGGGSDDDDARGAKGCFGCGRGNASDATESADELASGGVLRALWRDIGRYWLQWTIMLALGAVYLCVQFLLPVPGCPTGYIGPGGAADQGAYSPDCVGGAHRLVDKAFFGERHMYHNVDPITGKPVSAATCAGTYGCGVYDPEGVLGWISAAWMTFLGLQAGRVFVNYRAMLTAEGLLRAGRGAHLLRWAVWGVIFGLIGAGLAGFSKDGGIIPINKNLWSPSFVFVIAGLDFLCLAALYWIVDIAKLWSGAPFVYAGMNSIVVYAGSEILGSYFPFTAAQGSTFMSHAEWLTSNIVGVAMWLLVARILYLKKIFVNL